MNVPHDVMLSLNQLGFVSSGLILLIVNASLSRVRQIPGTIWYFCVSRYSYSCEIRDSEEAFVWVCKWLDDQRYLFNGVRSSSVTSHGSDQNAKFVLTPGVGKYYFRHGSRLFSVVRSRRELASTNGYGTQKTDVETVYLRVYFGSRAHMERVLVEAKALAIVRPDAVSTYVGSNTNWLSPMLLPKRGFDSVILPRDLEDEWLGDVEWFVGAKAWYRERGVPYRRGYMLYGEPGTGKTSAIRALCSRYNFNLGVIDARQAVACGHVALIGMFDSIPKPAVVLIEDIDRVCCDQRAYLDIAARTVVRHSPTGVPVTAEDLGSTAGRGPLDQLLNALDGVASAEDYIVIMTTNHPEMLDPALCRPGRIDRKFYLSFALPEQAERLFNHFYRGSDVTDLAVRFGELVGECKLVMAYLQELLLEHRDDPEAALARLQRHVDAIDPDAEAPAILQVNELGAVAA